MSAGGHLRRLPGTTAKEWQAQLEARKREVERRMEAHDSRATPMPDPTKAQIEQARRIAGATLYRDGYIAASQQVHTGQSDHAVTVKAALSAIIEKDVEIAKLRLALKPFASVAEIPSSVPGVEVTDDHFVTAEIPYAPHEQEAARKARKQGAEKPLALNVSLDGLRVGDFRAARLTLKETNHG